MFTISILSITYDAKGIAGINHLVEQAANSKRHPDWPVCKVNPAVFRLFCNVRALLMSLKVLVQQSQVHEQ